MLGAVGGALVARAAWFETLHDQEYLLHDARVFEEDGVKRPQHNPRLNSLAREIPRGDIYDRNGELLATSSWSELERHRAEYAALGVSINEACSRTENRHYPFGSATVHLLGDLRTGENFHATNASLIEHDLNSRLQGFQHWRSLARWCATGIKRFIPGFTRCWLRIATCTRPSTSVCNGTECILRKRLEPGQKSGAVVVMDAQTGDVLAMVSFPVPVPGLTGDTRPAVGPRALRSIPAGLDFQTGDGHRRAAARPRSPRHDLSMPAARARPRGHHDSRMESADPRRYRRYAHGTLNMPRAIRFLQRLFRAARNVCSRSAGAARYRRDDRHPGG